jgi:hypothetical protein
MSRVSVVTVTLNNARGLEATLASLATLVFKPIEVLIVDGGSCDNSAAVASAYKEHLAITFAAESDRGIYHAMNKGHKKCRGELVHYLNAGDTVFGEPYRAANQACLLPVHVHDESGRFFFEEFVRHGGYGYCHQGILFPRDHPEYSEEYRVAADLDLMIACFPRGVRELPMIGGGGAQFTLGGISSQAGRMRDDEVKAIFYRRFPWWVASRLQIEVLLKRAVPQKLRRSLVRAMHRGHVSAG